MIAQTDLESKLVVRRLTGTPGDDLVAWGLAIVTAAIAEEEVGLRLEHDRFVIEVPLPREDLLDRCGDRASDRALALAWLSSTEKGKTPPAGIPHAIDRDDLRTDAKTARAIRHTGAAQPVGGEAPAIVLRHPDADVTYPLYKALTKPGTQWAGYNAFVELVQKRLLTPEGLRLVLGRYIQDEQEQTVDLLSAMKSLGVTKGDELWRNPPGFLYPGLNKGPTMRLTGGSGVGVAGKPDWTLADRRDRGSVELYLAYVGYFGVARVLDGKGGRTVVVPVPADVRVPAVLGKLREVAPAYSTIEDFAVASASLAYGQAALNYWEDLAGNQHLQRYPEVFAGVHVSSFWQPNDMVYAPRRQAMAPLPAWLPAIRAHEGFSAASDSLKYHQRRIREVRGSFDDEKKLSGEGREAITAYVTALAGEPFDWLKAVAKWFPVVRTAGKRSVHMWDTEEVRRVLMALPGEGEIKTIVEDESFTRLADAIRAETVYPHLAREGRKRTGGDAPVFDPDYDLVTTLQEASRRRPEEFLRELYDFVSRYNERTLRRNEDAQRRGQYRRPMVRTEDLDRMTAWVEADRRGIVAAALLAFGTSLPSRHRVKQEAAREGIEAGEIEQALDAGEDEADVE